MASRVPSAAPAAVLLLLLLLPDAGMGGAVAEDGEWVKLPSKCEGEEDGGARTAGILPAGGGARGSWLQLTPSALSHQDGVMVKELD